MVNGKKYEIFEYEEGFLCQVKINGESVGEFFEAFDHERMFAWLRLMTGAYPGTDFNSNGDGDTQPGIAA